MQATIQKYRPLFRDFDFYVGSWCIAGLIGGVFAPVVATGRTAAFYTFVYQIIGGVLVGVLLSVLYTLFQNTFNPSRKRLISWTVAIGAWLVVRYGITILYLTPA